MNLFSLTTMGFYAQALREDYESAGTLPEDAIAIDTKTEQIIPFRFGLNISNAERIALSIATMQSNLFIRSFSSFYEYFIWISIILIGLYLIRLKRSKAVARSLLTIIIYLAVNMVLFQSNNQWVSPMIPLSLMTCILITSWTLCSKKEE